MAVLLGLLLFLGSSASAAAGAKNPRDLRTDLLTHPLGIDSARPLLTLDDESPYGAIHSEWNVEGNQATWKVTVSPNATALLSPRATNAESISFKGAPVESSELRTDSLGRLELPASSYTFIARLRKPASGSNGSQD